MEIIKIQCFYDFIDNNKYLQYFTIILKQLKNQLLL
jgi:hypothetical protein